MSTSSTQPVCQKIRERIDEAAPSELERLTGESPIREHLAGCADCRGHCAKAMALRGVLDEWRAPEPGENIAAGVMARIARREREMRRLDEREGFLERLAALLGHRFRVPAFAAFLLLVVLGASLTLNLAQMTRPPGSAQTTAVSDAGNPAGEANGNPKPVLYPSPFSSGIPIPQSAFRNPQSAGSPTPLAVTVAPGGESSGATREALERVFGMRDRFSTPVIVLIFGAPPLQGFSPGPADRFDSQSLFVPTSKENRL